MNNKYKIVFLIIFVLILWKSIHYLQVSKIDVEISSFDSSPQEQNINVERIKLTVYYEALCSDSRNFILKQLQPVYNILPDYLLLEFVPYGKAETIDQNGKLSFKCQHGSIECIANKIHACVLDYVKEQDIRLKYVSCMINDNIVPHHAGEKCAEKLGIEYEPIRDCANETKGSLLLKTHGTRTNEVSPVITFIPTIQVNGSSKISQAKLLKNLLKEICRLLENPPKECII